MTDIGHNSSTVNAGHLRAFVERIERMNEEIKALNTDKADIYSEARGQGFDAKALREVVKLRGMDRDKRVEHESIVDVYRDALGLS
jgi:uncharacterized protein (UPF0335 family)